MKLFNLKSFNLKSLKFFLLFITFFLLNNSIYSEENLENSDEKKDFFEKENFAISLNGGILFNLHSVNFVKFPNMLSCEIYNKSFGTGYLFSLGFEKKLTKNFNFGINFAYADRSVDIYHNSSFPTRNFNTNSVVNAKTRYNIDANLSYFELQPKIYFNLITNAENSALRLFFGVKIATPINHDFYQEERIESPSFVYFERKNADGKIEKFRNRYIASGEIGNISKANFGLNLGLNNLVKLSENLSWIQEINYDFAITNVSQNVDWKPQSINLSTGLRYNFNKKAAIIPIEKFENIEKNIEENIKKDDKIPVVENSIIPELNIKSLEFEGEIETGTEILATKPIVNAVFFEKNSSDLPNYLIFEPISQEEKYYENPVELYNKILPHIAEILQKNPNSSLNLVGATAGKNYENGGILLAEKRANSVKNAFLKLGISENRISISKKLMPEFPSNNDFEDGILENQRVDIIVKNAHLQEYVNLEKYSELVGNQRVNVKIENSNKFISDNFVEINSTFLTEKLNFLINKNENIFDSIFIFPLKKRISANENFFIVKTNLKFDKFAENAIDTINFSDLNVKNVETNYSNFEAIIRFDYNKSFLSDENKELLKQISAKIPAGFTIQILGGTDFLGSDSRNNQLSKERAEVTENFLNSNAKGKFKFETGINANKFDEKTPQGRMLNRSIFIKIKE
jgi:outer membrane protein OmpA-like peptidoglycan-associated protein